eukprot:48226-Eustigmatos_ZCMA.PRE.1
MEYIRQTHIDGKVCEVTPLQVAINGTKHLKSPINELRRVYRAAHGPIHSPEPTASHAAALAALCASVEDISSFG